MTYDELMRDTDAQADGLTCFLEQAGKAGLLPKSAGIHVAGVSFQPVPGYPKKVHVHVNMPDPHESFAGDLNMEDVN